MNTDNDNDFMEIAKRKRIVTKTISDVCSEEQDVNDWMYVKESTLKMVAEIRISPRDLESFEKTIRKLASRITKKLMFNNISVECWHERHSLMVKIRYLNFFSPA
jgi:hypothetical protein